MPKVWIECGECYTMFSWHFPDPINERAPMPCIACGADAWIFDVEEDTGPEKEEEQ